MAQWFYLKGSQKFGPVDTATLKYMAMVGDLDPSDLIWREGMEGWVESSQAKGLYSTTTPAVAKPVQNVVVVPPAPSPLVTSTDAHYPDQGDDALSQLAAVQRRNNPTVSPGLGYPAESSAIRSEQSQPVTAMIECRACRKHIAASAATCPGCGAPNEWLHPEIQRFASSLSLKGVVPAEAKVGYGGYKIWGYASKKHPGYNTHPSTWGPKLMIIGLLASLLSFCGGASPITMIILIIAPFATFIGLVGTLIACLSDKFPNDLQVEFDLDFSTSPPKWSCNDEQYWAGIRQFFRV